MEVIHPRCAGIDVSKRDAKVCVRVQGRGRKASVVHGNHMDIAAVQPNSRAAGARRTRLRGQLRCPE